MENNQRPSGSYSSFSGRNPLAADLGHILARTQGLWEEFRGNRIFITGGTGFFGCWLLESFVWANDQLGLGAEAVVLTRNPKAFAKKAPHLADHPTVHLHAGDVRNFEFPEGDFSHVVHAATEASAKLNEEDPLLMFDTIVAGTHRSLDFAVQCGAGKFLLTSSGAVYGTQPPELTHVPEDFGGAPDPVKPASAYGEGKRAAEILCAIYSRKHPIETKIARCFAFVGPYLPLDAHYAIGNFIRDGLRGGPIVVKGDGTPYRSYLYSADLAVWLWTILCRGQCNQPYNVGSEAQISIGDLAYTVASVFQPRKEVRILRNALQGKTAERYVPSTLRAQAELNLVPSVELDSSIRRTVYWHGGEHRLSR